MAYKRQKTALEIVTTITAYIGIALMAFGTITSIGYFLYNWGALDLALGLSAWNAFVLWVQMIGGGFILFVLSIVFAGFGE